MLTSLVAACAIVVLSALPGESAYLAARNAEDAGDYAGAITQYERVVAGDPQLAPYATIRIAACQAALKNSPLAVQAYSSALRNFGEGPWQRMAQAQLGRLYHDAGQHAEAAQFLLAALHDVTETWSMKDYGWDAAESAVQVPEYAPQGYAWLRNVALDTLWYRDREKAAGLLQASRKPDDLQAAMYGLLRLGKITDTGQLMISAIPSIASGGLLQSLARFDGTPAGASEAENAIHPDGWARVGLYYTVRRTAVDGNLGAAAQAADMLVKHFPDSFEMGYGLEALAQALEKAGQIDQAIKVYQTIAATNPNHYRADDGLIRAAELFQGQGNLQGAYETWNTLGRTIPESRFAALAHYKCAAVKAQQNDAVGRRWHLAKAAMRGSGDYYAHLAFDKLCQEAPAHGAPLRNLEIDGRNSFLRPFPLEEANRGPATSSSFEADPRLQRLTFFCRYGWEEGDWEATDLCRTYRDHPQAALLYQIMAERGAAFTVWQNADKYGTGKHGDNPTFDSMRVQYPRAYWGLVKEIAAENGVDPYLLLSIMRQESTFRPAVKSHAGATGLMQLMPGTAKWLAKSESYVTPVDAATLTNPRSSIRMGARYIKMMIDRSGGNLVYALASYNGGPGNCDKWRASFGNLPLEQFVENIGFSETQDYVKKVLGNYAAYHSLYPDEG
ncbi:MAG: transglycosylase SLT domain-containing protein [Candidatus Hydrogenedentes bacterium]|nr:transglycosylase SLT domain-containing protein [Candidatus Hydrogenedentota bacterium]